MVEPDWAGMFDRRCTARFVQWAHIQNGARCDLKRGHHGTAHMCERGLEMFVFSYDWETLLTPMGELLVEKRVGEKERKQREG